MDWFRNKLILDNVNLYLLNHARDARLGYYSREAVMEAFKQRREIKKELQFKEI